jgi:hypothetical protein
MIAVKLHFKWYNLYNGLRWGKQEMHTEFLQASSEKAATWKTEKEKQYKMGILEKGCEKVN